MVYWNTKIVTSEKKLLQDGKGQTDALEKKITKWLNVGWEIKGYSVDDKNHWVLLVKETPDP